MARSTGNGIAVDQAPAKAWENRVSPLFVCGSAAPPPGLMTFDDLLPVAWLAPTG
jgi:hypothetical protein